VSVKLTGSVWLNEKERTRCIAYESSVPQGMFMCLDKEVGWCVGIAVILVVERE
jgi:hypothetical protein